MLLSRYHFGRRSNQSRTSGTWITPIQMRSATIIAIQIKKRAVCLKIPMRINIASTAAIIKNIGELMNSGITASISVRFIVRIRICRIHRFSRVQRCKMDEETSPLRKAASTKALGKYTKWSEKVKGNLCDVRAIQYYDFWDLGITRIRGVGK